MEMNCPHYRLFLCIQCGIRVRYNKGFHREYCSWFHMDRHLRYMVLGMKGDSSLQHKYEWQKSQKSE